MKKGIVISIIIMIFLSLDVYAEDFKRGLGFTAGHISGVGFAYRQYFDKNGMQFTFGMLSNRDKAPKFPDEVNSSMNNYSITNNGWEVDGWISAMYLRNLRESEFTKFYFFVGGSLNIDYTEKYTQHYQSGDSFGSPDKKGTNDNRYYFGPGIGLDFQISKYISFIIELPVSISSDKKIETYVPQGAILVRF